jgi:hypothetical protein
MNFMKNLHRILIYGKTKADALPKALHGNTKACGIVGSSPNSVHSATVVIYRPIVPAPGDYDDGEIGGMMIGRGNRSIRRKPAPVPLCPPQTPHACPGANPGRRGGKPATNRLSYGTAHKHEVT